MFLSNPFNGAFGLDIGDLSIKMVQLLKHQRIGREPIFELKECRKIVIPPGYIINGELQQPEMVGKKILQLLGRDGKAFANPVKSPWVIADLPEPKTFIKLIDVEIPCNELTDEDVAFHAKKHFPLELEESYYDWQTIEYVCSNKKNTRVLIGVAEKNIVHSYTKLLEDIGLIPLALEIEAISLVRTLITANKTYEGEARAILDLGATRSSLIIYDHNSPQFSSSISFSGELLTTALVQHLKIDYKTAEELKIKNGLNNDEKYPAYLRVVMGLVDDLANNIKRDLQFFKEHFDSANPITHITMCGGVSNLQKLDMALSSKLKISSRLGNHWKNLNNPKFVDKIGKEQSSSFTSAVGLALRAASDFSLYN